MAHGKLRKHFSFSSWKGIFSFDPKGYHKIFQRRDKNLNQGNCVSCLTLTLFLRQYCCHLQWQHFSSLQSPLPPFICFGAICCLGVPIHLHLNPKKVPFSIRAFRLHEPLQPSLQFRSWQLFSEVVPCLHTPRITLKLVSHAATTLIQRKKQQFCSSRTGSTGKARITHYKYLC